MIADQQVVMKRGNRIDPVHHDPAGTVRVMTADGSLDAVRLDPFDARRVYPRATRTEPGDVVFLERPRPAARVDLDGGSLVSSPSRVLRLTRRATVRPHTLAALINELAPPESEWQTWNVPDMPPDSSQSLDRALATAARHLEELRRHERATQELVSELISGVTAGAVVIESVTTKSTTERRAG